MARSPDRIADRIKISAVPRGFLIQKHHSTRYEIKKDSKGREIIQVTHPGYTGGRTYNSQQMHDYLYDYMRRFESKPKLEIEDTAAAKLEYNESARLLDPNLGEKRTKISLELREFIKRRKPVKLEEIIEKMACQI